MLCCQLCTACALPLPKTVCNCLICNWMTNKTKQNPKTQSSSSMSSPTSCMSMCGNSQTNGGLSHQQNNNHNQHSLNHNHHNSHNQHNGLHSLFGDSGLSLDQFVVADGLIANCSSPTARLPPFCTINTLWTWLIIPKLINCLFFDDCVHFRCFWMNANVFKNYYYFCFICFLVLFLIFFSSFKLISI